MIPVSLASASVGYVVALGMIAAALTGSRLALGALLLGLLLDAFLRRRVWALAVTGLFGALLLVAIPIAHSTWSSSRNLLEYSNDYRARVWDHSHASSFTASNRNYPGPVSGFRATRLRAESRESGRYANIVLTQYIGVSLRSEPYVASVYLRSDHPQKVRLGDNLTTVTCMVTERWNRCVTPIARGDGNAVLELQLMTLSRGSRFDVYTWGAQVEKGTHVTAAQVTGRGILERGVATSAEAVEGARCFLARSHACG